MFKKLNCDECVSVCYFHVLTGFSPPVFQELTDINKMIRQGGVSRKRAFSMEGDYSGESPTKRVCPESEDVLLKRLQDVVSERAHH